MPLADYVDEVMKLLSDRSPPGGEVLVERVKRLRWAERSGSYEHVFSNLNAP
jgi:uncharacterized oxidoreductase